MQSQAPSNGGLHFFAGLVAADFGFRTAMARAQGSGVWCTDWRQSGAILKAARRFLCAPSYLLLRDAATVASAFALLVAAATSLVTIVLPIGASAIPASFKC